MDEIKLPHDHGQDLIKGLDHMPSTEEFQIVSEVFKQISDPTRIKIFWILCHCEECVINISALMEMTSPAVSHHLRQLKGAGLIKSRRAGKEVYYKAAESKEADLLHDMIELLLKIACPSK